MAEAIGVAASIVGILAALRKTCSNIKSIHDAPLEARNLQTSLQAVTATLNSLQASLSCARRPREFERIWESSVDLVLRNMRVTVSDLNQKVGKVGKTSLLRRIKWTLDRDEALVYERHMQGYLSMLSMCQNALIQMNLDNLVRTSRHIADTISSDSDYPFSDSTAVAADDLVHPFSTGTEATSNEPSTTQPQIEVVPSPREQRSERRSSPSLPLVSVASNPGLDSHSESTDERSWDVEDVYFKNDDPQNYSTGRALGPGKVTITKQSGRWQLVFSSRPGGSFPCTWGIHAGVYTTNQSDFDEDKWPIRVYKIEPDQEVCIVPEVDSAKGEIAAAILSASQSRESDGCQVM